MPDPVTATLEAALTAHPNGPLYVAFSGGPDSTVLLHALAMQPAARRRGLHAVHVDHGLQSPSRAWAAHCEVICKHLDIPLTVRRVTVVRDGKGTEDAARQARYAALADCLPGGGVLLTAHHRDDQIETVLLKLLRGSGVEGLAGIRPWRPFAGGWLWRPLLDVSRPALTDYVKTHDLDVIDDPSNQSRDYARNYLRHDVVPLIRQRWPRAGTAIAHAADLSRDADDYLEQAATSAFTNLFDTQDRSLDARGWLLLHPALQGRVLAHWLHGLGLMAPGLGHLDQLRRQIGTESTGQTPQVDWPGTVVHIWRSRLYADAPQPAVDLPWQTTWDGTPLRLPDGSTLRLEPAGNASATRLVVRLGQTGTRLRPAGKPHTRKLAHLFQEIGMPPWQRPFCPLILDTDGTLLAVADLWLTEAGQHHFDATRQTIVWTK